MSNPDQQKPPKWMKFSFTPDEHRVWESVFPPLEGNHTPDEAGFTPRRRRPSALYMTKIVRSLAELGVYPVARTTAKGQIVPWDATHEPQQSWRLDPGIRALLTNLSDADPDVNIDAYYHPADLAAHFGADGNQWKYWPQGMTGVRPGPRREDVVLNTTLDANCVDYIRRRNILKRPMARTTLVSTGGVAFFASAAVEFWTTADDRARIGRLKTKLAVDFKVLRNNAPLPADPAITDLAMSIFGFVPSAKDFATVPPAVKATVEKTHNPAKPAPVATPEPVSQLPLFVQPVALSPEDELRRIEARAAELRREIEERDLERRVEDGRRRHHADIEAFRTAVGSAKVSAVDLHAPDFNPRTPDRSVSDDIRIDGVILALPDGREFVFGTGRLVEKEVPDIDADRAAFEADPVGYTFGG